MPTEEQIEVGCDVARAKINEKITARVGAFATGFVTDEDIREIVKDVLTAAENVLGGESS